MSTPTFNHALCAELHNRILSIGWSAPHDPSRTPDPLSFWQFWFTSHPPHERGSASSNANAEDSQVDEQLKAQLERRLAPGVLKFLQTARHDCPGIDGFKFFFFGVNGLQPPEMMLSDLDGAFWHPDDRAYPRLPSDEKDRYLGLYFTGYSAKQWRGEILSVLNNLYGTRLNLAASIRRR
jgi:hypothetical protein